MTLKVAFALAVGVFFASECQPVAAQFGGIGLPNRTDIGSRQRINRTPTVSPYLNLVNLSGSSASEVAAAFSLPNYQTLVRPQIDQRQSDQFRRNQLNDLQGQVHMLRTDMLQQQQQGEIFTGHPTRFMTYSHFYPTLR